MRTRRRPIGLDYAAAKDADCKRMAHRAKRQIALRYPNHRFLRYAPCAMRFALFLEPCALRLFLFSAFRIPTSEFLKPYTLHLVPSTTSFPAPSIEYPAKYLDRTFAMLKFEKNMDVR